MINDNDGVFEENTHYVNMQEELEEGNELPVQTDEDLVTILSELFVESNGDADVPIDLDVELLDIDLLTEFKEEIAADEVYKRQ